MRIEKNMNINVTKRDGSKEAFDIDKIHKVLEWATEGIDNVSISQIELRANIELYDGIQAYEIHELLIRSASNLISKETPDYQYVCGRLINYKLRKETYNSYNPPHLRRIVKNNVEKKLYKTNLLDIYTPDDYDEFNKHIDHDRDFDIPFAGMQQFREKYLVKNRTTGEIVETPQIAFMLISMTIFQNYDKIYDKNTRKQYILDYYDAISQYYITLPTPVIAGARTPEAQYASCVLVALDDNLDSYFRGLSVVGRYASNRAGLGIYAGQFRAEGQPVANGSKYHTGLTGFYRAYESLIDSISQGGIRKSSATVFYPIFHYEFENLITLKNTTVSHEKRVEHLDYAVQTNKLFYERYITKGNITFFTPDEVPDLWEAFYSHDYDLFVRLYEQYENDDSKTKITMSAVKVFDYITIERKQTGRIYISNMDLANKYTPFYDKIYQQNLCVEISTPTYPLCADKDPERGEISHCTLSAINLGKLDHYDDFERINDLAVRALDEIMDIQDYYFDESIKAKYRRNLAIGWTNLAYFLAKRGLKYDESAFEIIHQYAESHMYYCLKASALLAKDKMEYHLSQSNQIYPNKYNIEWYNKNIVGNYEWANSSYSNEEIVLPIDNYKDAVDELVQPNYVQDWESLRSLLREAGCMNSTFVGMMPCENSTLPANSTSGLDRVKSLITQKESQNTMMTQVVPEIDKCAENYELVWPNDNKGAIKINGIIQKFTDQAISTNVSYDPSNYKDNIIPQSLYMEDILIGYKYGLKTFYYHNTKKDASQDDDIDENCESCSI